MSSIMIPSSLCVCCGVEDGRADVELHPKVVVVGDECVEF